MPKNISNKRYTIIALVFAVFMIASTYSNAYAQYGGGGGGAGAFTITSSFVGTGSGQNPIFDIENIFGIMGISMQLSQDVGTVTLVILEVTKPISIPDAPGIVLQYYRFTIPAHVNNALIDATIDIKVSKSDLEKFNVDPDSLKMYRYNEATGMWEEVLMEKVGEDEANIYYQARVSSFSFFALTGNAAAEIPPEMLFSKTFTVEGFDVPVTLTNGEVESIDVNIDEKSIELVVDVQDDAILTIEIPRELLDSKNPDGTDAAFSIIIDGDLADYEETVSDDKRVLTIELTKSAEDISIMGTFVVPEFGIIAMMILAVSIAGTLIASRKYIKI